jgi:hypothetical protein
MGVLILLYDVLQVYHMAKVAVHHEKKGEKEKKECPRKHDKTECANSF